MRAVNRLRAATPALTADKLHVTQLDDGTGTIVFVRWTKEEAGEQVLLLLVLFVVGTRDEQPLTDSGLLFQLSASE